MAHDTFPEEVVEGMRVRVLVADDDPSFRDALCDILASDEGVVCAAVGKDAREAIDLALREQPDVALIDVRMPAGGGAVAAAGIRECSPKTRVFGLSMHHDDASLVDMLRAGASGYVVKGSPAEEILDAIHRGAAGHGILSSAVTGKVIDELLRQLDRADQLSAEVADFQRAQSELIQVLSHELLTPVTVILGTVGVLERTDVSSDREQLSRLLDAVQSAGRRMKRLVTNIATSARLQREETLKTHPVRLAQIVAASVEDIEEADHRLLLPHDLEQLVVHADPELAAEALRVVIENALEIAPPPTPVELSCRPHDSGIDLVVLDRGPGIPLELRERVFEPFVQVSTGDRRTHQGLGVGLSLTRSIMHLHGGTTWVEERDGGGSVFVLRFPMPETGAGSHDTARLSHDSPTPKIARAGGGGGSLPGATGGEAW